MSRSTTGVWEVLGEQSDLDVSDCYRVLAVDRRRTVVDVLADRTTPVELEDLAETVATREGTGPRAHGDGSTTPDATGSNAGTPDERDGGTGEEYPADVDDDDHADPDDARSERGAEREPFEDAIDTTATSLHHNHLPVMDEAGLVEYDPDANRIESRSERLDVLSL